MHYGLDMIRALGTQRCCNLSLGMVRVSAIVRRTYWLTASTRRYSIKVTAADATKPQSVPPPRLRALPTLLAQALHMYKTEFPRDVAELSKIESLERLTHRANNRVKVGVVYSDYVSMHSKVVEILLADPLALENETWWRAITNRNRQTNHIFTHDTAFSTDGTNFQVPSPLLSAFYRLPYTQALQHFGKTVPAENNDMELVEINSSSNVDVNLIHIFINVVSDVAHAASSVPPFLKDQIVITVIDSDGFTPSSTDATPLKLDIANPNYLTKVNSKLYYKAINDFLKDPQNGTQFVDGLVGSNLFELSKILTLYLRTPILSQFYIRSIANSLQTANVRARAGLERVAASNPLDTAQFSELAHSELQYNMIPKTEAFFKHELSWWKMYLKNDNVEYDLKDFFNREFMNQSIERYNFVRGKIVSQLQSDGVAEYADADAAANPLLQMKNEVINERLPREVQPVVYSAIVESVLMYHIPIGLVALGAYGFLDFTLNLAVAIASLGLAAGFNHGSKKWEKFSHKWMRQLFEDIRVCAGYRCIENGLIKEFEIRRSDEEKLYKLRAEILSALDALTSEPKSK